MIRTHSISYGRQLWLGALATLALGFFALAPSTLAATDIDFNSNPEAQYKLYEGADYVVPVKVTTVNMNNTITFSIAKTQQFLAYTQIGSYNYQPGFNTVQNFKWDGKLAGQYVSPGTYSIQVKGVNANNEITLLNDTVEVTEAYKVTVTNAPTTWNRDLGTDYKLDYKVEEVTPVCVILTVGGEVTQATSALGAGSYTRTWNGKINGQTAAVGNYDWKLYADPVICVVGSINGLTPVSTGMINVTENQIAVPAPKISNLGMTISPFSPNNDGKQDTTTASFTLNTTANVTIEVKKGNTVVKNLMNKESHSTGNVSVVWNGKDAGNSVVADGNYTISVMAQNTTASDSGSVNVEVNTYVPPVVVDNNCAGFTDLPKNYSHCDEVTFVKNAGIMTGNDNGTFAPDEILQRDQVAKTSLEAFGLFNKNSDYCGGNAAFSDVSKSQWSYQYVCRGVNLGMITGYKSGADAGKYVPARGVNRVEALALILRNLDDSMPANDKASYKDVELNQWFTGFAKYAMDHSLFTGSYLYPTEQVTRLEMAEMLYKLDQQGKL